MIFAALGGLDFQHLIRCCLSFANLVRTGETHYRDGDPMATRADPLEKSIATALNISQQEYDHLVVLKRLRNEIEDMLRDEACEKFASASLNRSGPKGPSGT